MRNYFRIEKLQKNHFLSAFSGGLFGFILFFIIILLVKTLSYLLGTINQFRVESDDFLLSGIGLILMALIKVLEELRLKEPLS